MKSGTGCRLTESDNVHPYVFLRRFGKCGKKLLAASCPSVRPSVCLFARIEYLATQWTDFLQNLYW
jgi:hypothetical protein